MKEVTKDSFKVLKHILWYVVVLIVILVLCLISKYFFIDQIQIIDENILKYINDTFVSNTLTGIMKVITVFGSAWVLIPLALILLIFLKNKKYGMLASINLLGVYLLNCIMKHIFERPRPELQLVKETSYSFPSSHTMCSVAFYGLLIVLIHKKMKNKCIKYSLIALLTMLVVLIAFSRLYLQVHYLSDVIMGAVFGLIILAMFVSILKYLTKEN